MTTHVCTRLSREKHVYVLKHYQVKDKAKKLRLKKKIGCQAIRRQETQDK
jgi:hypothetical protein